MKILLDTSVLMEDENFIKNNKDKEIIICSKVIEELDKLKDNNYNNEKSIKAHKALIAINNDIDNIIYKESINNYDNLCNDDIILKTCKEYYSKIATYDKTMIIKAKINNIKIYPMQKKEQYKGYYKFEGCTSDINNFFENINEYNLLENQYVIIHDTDLNRNYEYIYKQKELKMLSLPPSKIIKGLNANQRCALDLLTTDSMPIKFIIGNFGSGKTMLSVKTALYKLNDNYEKLLFVRNPIVSGEEIGFLPGSKEEKTIDFFKPLLQYIDDKMLENEKFKEKIKLEIVSYMKGVSVDNTIMIVDEAEDLSSKLIKMLGTRIGKNSEVIFIGDYKQAENKYKNNNGLLKAIDSLKDNPLVGIIYLDADVRSDASKVFADM